MNINTKNIYSGSKILLITLSQHPDNRETAFAILAMLLMMANKTEIYSFGDFL